MVLPQSITRVIDSLSQLPGIGPKTAERLTFYLLHVPQTQLDRFGDALKGLRQGTVLCGVCKTVTDTDPCSVCSDPLRDADIICVVEQTLDMIAIEKSGTFKGVYHVLHGSINPLNNIGPDELYIPPLLNRIKDRMATLKEIIIATNPTMEGDATGMYLSRHIHAISQWLKISRIGRGLPVGADIEYADDVTLSRALEGRTIME
jgi:recombination protein RecR